MPHEVTQRSDILVLLADTFREHGYEGASLSLISKATGLGKGSLYHFFPGGKEEMLQALLAEIHDWFETNIFLPLISTTARPMNASSMLTAVATYFQRGKRVCLLGVLATGSTHDRIADAINHYFRRWIDVLARSLEESGKSSAVAQSLAEETVLTIQGAIILARAQEDYDVFDRAMARLHTKLQQGGE